MIGLNTGCSHYLSLNLGSARSDAEFSKEFLAGDHEHRLKLWDKSGGFVRTHEDSSRIYFST